MSFGEPLEIRAEVPSGISGGFPTEVFISTFQRYSFKAFSTRISLESPTGISLGDLLEIVRLEVTSQIPLGIPLGIFITLNLFILIFTAHSFIRKLRERGTFLTAVLYRVCAASLLLRWWKNDERC